MTPTKHGKSGAIFCFIALLAVSVAGGGFYKRLTSLESSNSMLSGFFAETVLNDVQPEANAISAANTKREILTVQRKITNANPFLPHKELQASLAAPPKFEIIEPPSSINEGSDAARVMDTSVSGILYDSYSPSAIINIEGNDQLVKKGDIISNYEVIDIDRNTVTVKLGKNTYRAGIGEMLTSNEVYHNNISNLDRKFGGKNGN